MKKKFYIAILTAVLLLNLLPGMTPSASADDTSQRTVYTKCKSCHREGYFLVKGFIPTPISSTPDPVLHWAIIECMSCGNEQECSGGSTDNGGIFKHTGGTETPTCTTGKTCERCGAEYGKLGHDWSEWTSSGDNKTHKRTCQRDGCGAVDTADCGGGSATCVTPGTCTDCGGQYYSGHTFPARWDWASDTQVGRDAESHWVWCLNCTEGKAHYSDHLFGPGNMYLASPATCVSKPVYYKNCSSCYYKGTETYEYEWGILDPNNHTGNEEIRDAVAATCTQDGYTGDTYCKDCDTKLASGTAIPATGHTGGTEVRGAKDATCTTAGYTGDTYCKDCGVKLASGTAIPATGHTGGTATCLRRAKCETCGERYGDIAPWRHSPSCVAEWTVTETEHEQKYSLCGAVATEKGEHTFGDWTITREAAPGEEGEQERVCELCEYTETEATPALEIEESPAPAPTAEPVPAAEPAAEPVEPAQESDSVWWIFLLAGVAAGVGAGVAVRRKKKK